MLLSEIYQNEKLNDVEISFVTADSRKAGPGGIFVCIVGANSDGHHYIPQAYERGCRVFVCQKDHEIELPSDAVVILHDDTRESLAVLSAAVKGNPAEKLRLIGITGTKGKTSTAYYVNSILKAAGKKTVLIGSTGIFIGDEHIETANTTPDPILLNDCFEKAVKKGCEYAVMEVSSQAIKHKRVFGLDYEIAVFTNLSEDHISPVEHPDFEDYRACKSKLFSMSDISIINTSDDNAEWMEKEAKNKKITVSFGENSDIKVNNIRFEETENHFSTVFDLNGEQYCVPIPGKFSAMNAAEAVIVCKCLGIDSKIIHDTLSSAVIPGRFETVSAIDGVLTVIDYAHNELSLSSVLSVLKEYMDTREGKRGRLICLFGSVGNKAENRRATLAQAAQKYSDFVIVTSDNPDKEKPSDIMDDIERGFDRDFDRYVKIESRRDAVFYAVSMAVPGDVILLAGKGHEDYQIINGEKVHYSDREELIRAAGELTEPRVF